jgi:NAD(P)-dependent dehydrogenase (short-subunit alcohol dehydrogenase family)
VSGEGGAVVTGAAGGLGFEIARRLHHAGYVVHLTDVARDAVSSAAARLGEPAWASELDVADPEACRAVALATVERAGSLALWVNNAGILRTKPSWAHPDEERRLLLSVNLEGTINGTVAALGPMRAARRGHVLNVVSLSGIMAGPGQALYAASKHGALAFGIGTALDLRVEGLDDIHVSSLCPHGIWTPMLDELADDPWAAASWAGREMLQAGDVADIAMELVRRPRPFRAVPRSQGPLLRLYAALPRVALATAPRVMASARRRQRAFRESTPGG